MTSTLPTAAPAWQALSTPERRTFAHRVADTLARFDTSTLDEPFELQQAPSTGTLHLDPLTCPHGVDARVGLSAPVEVTLAEVPYMDNVCSCVLTSELCGFRGDAPAPIVACHAAHRLLGLEELCADIERDHTEPRFAAVVNIVNAAELHAEFLSDAGVFGSDPVAVALEDVAIRAHQLWEQHAVRWRAVAHDPVSWLWWAAHHPSTPLRGERSLAAWLCTGRTLRSYRERIGDPDPAELANLLDKIGDPVLSTWAVEAKNPLVGSAMVDVAALQCSPVAVSDGEFPGLVIGVMPDVVATTLFSVRAGSTHRHDQPLTIPGVRFAVEMWGSQPPTDVFAQAALL